MYRDTQGAAASAELPHTGTWDFGMHKMILCPLHMGMGSCYNLFTRLGSDEGNTMYIETDRIQYERP